jgi:hypothetical protein
VPVHFFSGSSRFRFFFLSVLFYAVVMVVLFWRRRLLLGCEQMVVSTGVVERLAILGSGGGDFWCGY